MNCVIASDVPVSLLDQAIAVPHRIDVYINVLAPLLLQLGQNVVFEIGQGQCEAGKYRARHAARTDQVDGRLRVLHVMYRSFVRPSLYRFFLLGKYPILSEGTTSQRLLYAATFTCAWSEVSFS